MGWTATNPTTIGGDTKKSDWDALWDNCDFCYVPPATVEFFGQSSAPTGWTKKTDWVDNSMLVYTTGSIGSGGSDDPTSWITAITTQDESSHTHPMPHTHSLVAGTGIYDGNAATRDITGQPSIANTGSGSEHSHGVNQDTFSPYYQKIIAATKDAGSWIAANPVSAIGDAMKQNAHWAALWANIDYCYLEATTIQFFGQSSAPTGWTKKTDWTDNSMLVYTTGSISSGGSDNPTSWTTAITIQNESSHAHSLQSHTHMLVIDSPYQTYSNIQNTHIATGGPSNANTSGGSAHNHTANQDTFSPLYQQIIAATKDSGDWIDTDPVSLYDPTKKNDYDTAWDNIVFNYLAAGTIKSFGQSSAPTSWTKKTDWTDNSMLIYTTGSISSGGSDDPTNWTTAISLNNESSHTHPMPHTHTFGSGSFLDKIYSGWQLTTGPPSNSNTSAGTAHLHGVNQDIMSSKYQTIIMAIKNA